MNLTINGIPISVDPIAAQEIVRKHLLNGEAKDVPMIAIAGSVNVPQLQKSERFIGSYSGPDGKVTLAILMPGEKKNVTWPDAQTWAKEQGGDLPSRVEGLLLYLHHRDQFQKDDVLWLNEQHAAFSGTAWYQYFYDGYQGYWYEDYKLLARAVRRVTI